MTFDSLLQSSCRIALVAISVSLLVALYRLVRGPTLPDRIVAMDMLSFLVIAYVAVLVVMTKNVAFLDAASTLALITFVSTVAFARYLDGGSEPAGKKQREGRAP
ncbi:MAG: cation:proton antiporter [Planctomycetota bacterium]